MAVKEKPRQLNAEKPDRPQFVPCGRRSSLGGFDPLGYLPGRNPEGSDCLNGLRSWWSHTVMGEKGEAIHSKDFVLVTAECRCLKRWKYGSAALPAPKSPEKAALDSKAKAAGE